MNLAAECKIGEEYNTRFASTFINVVDCVQRATLLSNTSFSATICVILVNKRFTT